MHPTQAPYPTTRFRRLRRTPALRALVQEHVLSAGDLIWPVFLCDGTGQRQPVAIGQLPGNNDKIKRPFVGCRKSLSLRRCLREG